LFQWSLLTMNTTTPMTATIYHNPDCGTSRNTLALIRHAGIEPTVIEYLRTPPSRKQLTKLIDEAMLKPREALREKGTPFAELGLDEAGITDDVIIDAMLQHPILINRPFVVTPRGTRLCRPSEVVLNILPPNLQPFTKEDGEVVVGREPLAIFPDADPR
jgi:arsenate reductase